MKGEDAGGWQERECEMEQGTGGPISLIQSI